MLRAIKNIFNKRQSVLGERSEWIPFSNNFPPTKSTRLATVGRCLRMYSDFLLQTELVTKDGKPHYILDLLEQPNSFDTKKTFYEKLVFELLMNGNFHCYIDSDNRGQVKALLPYRSGQLYAYANKGEYSDPISIHKKGFYYQDFKGRVFMPDEILHLKDMMFNSSDNLNGYARTYIYELNFQSGYSIQQVQCSLSQSGLRPPLLLTGLPESDKEGLKNVRDTVKSFFKSGQSAAAGGVLTLPEGYDIKNLMLQSPERALEFLSSTSDLNIARIFCVPIELLARSDAEGQSGGNHLKEANRFFIKTTMKSFLKNVSNALEMLSMDGTKFEFLVDKLRASDLREESQYWSQMVTAGIYSPEEAKEKSSM